MEQLIINRYKSNVSIESLAKEFKLGKNRIKKILLENNVPIKPKGGQIKYHNTIDSNTDYSDKILICKSCGKKYDDVENKSGGIITHIKKCFPSEVIPSSFKRRMYLTQTGEYWHFKFFNITNKIKDLTISCLECGWETKDIKNTTGSLSKHIERHHGTVNDYIEKYPEQLHLFTTITKFTERCELFNEKDNFISCKICGEQFKTISNTHLNLHNTTTQDYKLKYGENSLISENTKKEFVSNLSKCEHNFQYRSKSEIEIEEFIKSFGVNVVVCDKKQLNGVELDLYLPDYNIAIEYNGLYWHSEKQGKHKTYHLNKTLKCVEKNIQLIHIFSDEWLSKKEIVKNRLINILRLNDKKIYARKCDIVSITNKEKNEFLELHHLQGSDKSTIFYGLKYNNQLVSVITFGTLRRVLGNKIAKNNEYELYRYCSNNVIGGFTKLLKHFIKNHLPKKIITYSNRNWSPTKDYCFYSKVGFNYVGETKPNYSYTKKYETREHRFNYRKDKLVKMGYDKSKSETLIMCEIGYDKIWDTGNLKYEMSF